MPPTIATKYTINLYPEFRIKIHEALRIGEQEGIEIHPYCGVRTCVEQAILYRSTRTLKEIESKMRSLTDRSCPFLAQILLDIGPQQGPLGRHKTKAGPGESWHQYAMAEDCVPIVGGKALWNDDAEEWQVYGAIVRSLGLTWAGDWTGFREYPHCQLHPTSSPLSHFKDPIEIESILKQVGSL
jgi:peptidoglycan L-alanyl-D-glutamate endopeptidase CwlK